VLAWLRRYHAPLWVTLLSSMHKMLYAIGLFDIVFVDAQIYAQLVPIMTFLLKILWRFMQRVLIGVIGSACWARTSDPMINSHLLYQLS
jgi:hypothetical protein